MKSLKRFAGIATATVLGTGYFPFGPGTVGSIAASAMFLVVRVTCPTWVEWAALAVILPLAWWGCREGYRMWGDDPSRVNVDEFAGCWIATLTAPVSWGIWGIVSGLVLFRFFDILKPWPVSLFDRMKTPEGILLDDLAAGFLSAILIVLGAFVHAGIL